MRESDGKTEAESIARASLEDEGPVLERIEAKEMESAARRDLLEEPKRSGLNQLYEYHAASSYRLAYVITGDRDLANDLVQEAFARVVHRFGHLRHREAFESYLRRTVVNLANSHFRRQVVERRAAMKATTIDKTATIPDLETRDVLWTLVLSLPARQRLAVVLRYYEDMSESETAALLGISARAVNSLISRALEKLRKQEDWETWTR